MATNKKNATPKKTTNKAKGTINKGKWAETKGTPVDISKIDFVNKPTK